VQGDVGLEELVEMVSDPKLRLPAARLVRDLGAEAEPAVPALGELLKSDDSDMVAEAATMLGAVGPGARDAAMDLSLCAVDLRPRVSNTALGALRRIGWEFQFLPPALWTKLLANRDRVYSLFLDPEQFRQREPAPAAMADPRPRYLTTDADLAHLAGLRYLRVLELSQTRIHDSGIAHLAGLDQLTWLSLSNTGITSQGLAHLANLRELRWLDLSRCPIDDDGLRHLNNLLKLESLSLTDTQVSDVGLSNLKVLTGLRRLDLKGKRLTRPAVDELRKSMPDLNIIWQESP
jgi:HEAT repeat protein